MVDHVVRLTASASLLAILLAGLPPVSAADANPLMLVVTGQPVATDSDADRSEAERNVPNEQERLVLQMVRHHLPELETLLDQLRAREPRQYEVAIRNLGRSARRLENARRRGEEAFEIEVSVVQAQSGVNLLIAKLKVRDSKKDRQALRQATKRLTVAELARSRHELSLMQSRLQRLQEQVATTKERIGQRELQLEETIQNNYQTYLKKSGQKE